MLTLATLGIATGCREPNSLQSAQPASAESHQAPLSTEPQRSNLAERYESRPFCNIEYLGDREFADAALLLSASTRLTGWLADEPDRLVTGASLVPAGLAPGLYHLYLIYRVENHSYSCDSGRRVKISG
jgi:hypothetical protein